MCHVPGLWLPRIRACRQAALGVLAYRSISVVKENTLALQVAGDDFAGPAYACVPKFATSAPVEMRKEQIATNSHGRIPASKPVAGAALAAAPIDEEKQRPIIELSEEQKILTNMLYSGRNVFITGNAGSGKSLVLKRFVKDMKKKKLAVMAPTGLAATHINGRTVASATSMATWPSNHNPYDIANMINRCDGQRSNFFLSTDIWVLDEASMMHPSLFSVIEQVFQHLRVQQRRQMAAKKPFGGMQVIISGDFAQLPPIAPDSQTYGLIGSDRRVQGNSFLFEAQAWKKLMNGENAMQLVDLQQVHRQHSDPQFAKMLNQIRWGWEACTQETLDALYSRQDCHLHNGDVEPTILCSHRADAEEHNSKQLELLPGTGWAAVAVDRIVDQKANAGLASQKSGLPPKEGIEKLAPETLILKIGAQVVLTRNLDTGRGLVNGARGVIRDFREECDQQIGERRKLPVVEFANGEILRMSYFPFRRESTEGLQIRRFQLPLKLAWALTVHKSQGMSLDRVAIDIPHAFASGQAYTALSRARSLEGIFIKRLPKNSIYVDPKVKEFYKRADFQRFGPEYGRGL